MNRTLPLIAICAALALSACSREPEAESSASPSVGPSAAAETETAVPLPAPSQSGAAIPDASADAGAIPTTLHGRWGLVPADCTSTKGDAKGLLEISAGQLKFYESVAKLGTIKEAGESNLRATFDFSGEGQSWTQDVVLDAQDGGKVLTRRDYGPDAMPGPLKYTRCT